MSRRAIDCMKVSVAWFPRLLALSLVLLAAGTGTDAAEQQPKVLRGFVLHNEQGPDSQVIETPEALAAFVACLPDRLPHMKEPAPANPDPMRRDGFALDFAREVLVVCVHHDTISAFPEYKGSSVEGQTRLVNFDVPSPPPEARPYGWGVYTAVVLPRAAQGTVLHETMVKGDW